MRDSSELDQLVAEYNQLDLAVQSQRAKDLLTRAAALVDRKAAPKKWAAMRSLFGDLAEHNEPGAAVTAYRDALLVWDPVEQRDAWIHCHLQLGCLLASAPPGSTDAESALVHLEHAVSDHPYLARLLATLFGLRPLGDPAENWRRRIKYIESARAQTNPGQNLATWAAVSNELACAYPDEPGGDYAAAVEKRINLHCAVLETLRRTGGSVLDTCMHLATAYLDRVEGSIGANGLTAESYVQEALAACPDGADDAVRVQLLLLRARCLIFKQAQQRSESLNAALVVLQQARDLAARRPQRELCASVEKLMALAYLELLRLGQRGHLEAFSHCCAKALALFDGPTFVTERRKLLQIQADGLLAVDEFIAAGDCCAEAVTLAEGFLALAVTTAGRLERIWELRDSAALLAYCRARAGDLAAAVEALDIGKARLWNPTRRGPVSTRIADHIPRHGALILPVLAGPEGIVILATGGDAGVAFTRVDLPGFGKSRVLELQRGPNPATLGGWLRAYCYRRSEPGRFQHEIVSIGEVLHHEFWQPVLDRLGSLGVVDGAELVLFPQGASASLPMQAASWMQDGQRRWLSERFALRLAPSLATLSRAAAPCLGPQALTVVAANPDGDLKFDVFEIAWIQAVNPRAQTLVGSNATRERVLAALNTSSQVHIATHAEFNHDDPLGSRLRVWDGDLTVMQLVEHLATNRPGFVALSACETGVTRVTSLADEFLGFPAALLEAGVCTVLATQWSVDDEGSALLMGQFYRECDGGECSTAESLRRAQNWLRTLTVSNLLALLRVLRDRGGAAGELAGSLRAGLRGRDGAECPFAHPYFWAGFCVVGGLQ